MLATSSRDFLYIAITVIGEEIEISHLLFINTVLYNDRKDKFVGPGPYRKKYSN